MKRFKVGDRVQCRVKIGWRGVSRNGTALPAYGIRRGRIVAIVYVPETRTYASEVRFDDGGTQLNLNSDLKHIR